MFRSFRKSLVLGAASALLLAAGAASNAATIAIPGGSLYVPADDSSGVSFKYHGTINTNTELSISISGVSFLQGDDQFGTNGAGVIVDKGFFPGEGVGEYKDLWSKAALGSLVLEANGFGPAVLHPDVATGLGSSKPPTTLVFTGKLSAIFQNFTPINNPVFTFVVADQPGWYFDNSGGFTVTQVSSVPAPAAAWQSLAGLVGLGLVVRRRNIISFLTGSAR